MILIQRLVVEIPMITLICGVIRDIFRQIHNLFLSSTILKPFLAKLDTTF